MKIQYVMLTLVFVVSFTLLSLSKFALLPAAPKTALQLVSGDLYGICAPIEHLRELNR